MSHAKPFNPWPISIVGLGLFFLSLTAWSVIQARSGVSTVTDPAYYSHGLKFQETTVERQAAASAGWRLRTNLDGLLVGMHLTDREKRPVTGASGELQLFADGAKRDPLQMEEASPGRYEVRLPDNLQGGTPALALFRRDGSLFEQRLQLNLAPAK